MPSEQLAACLLQNLLSQIVRVWNNVILNIKYWCHFKNFLPIQFSLNYLETKSAFCARMKHIRSTSIGIDSPLEAASSGHLWNYSFFADLYFGNNITTAVEFSTTNRTLWLSLLFLTLTSSLLKRVSIRWVAKADVTPCWVHTLKLALLWLKHMMSFTFRRLHPPPPFCFSFSSLIFFFFGFFSSWLSHMSLWKPGDSVLPRPKPAHLSCALHLCVLSLEMTPFLPH